MAKAARSLFVCQNCGAVAPRWTGKCAACGEWNTIVEEAQAAAVPGTGLAKSSKGRAAELRLLADTDGDKLNCSAGVGRAFHDHHHRGHLCQRATRGCPQRRRSGCATGSAQRATRRTAVSGPISAPSDTESD